jgi:hypothetical protein
MISDILSDALQAVSRYLVCEPEAYGGDARVQVLSLMLHMRQVIQQLDSLPSPMHNPVQAVLITTGTEETQAWVHATSRHAQRWPARLGRRCHRAYEAVMAFALWLFG